MKTGFTLIEMLMVIGLLALAVGIVLAPFVSFRSQQALSGGAGELAALITSARAKTLASEGDTVYGVHLEVSRATLFAGSTYVAGAASNQVLELNSLLTLSTISLNGGGVDMIFNRLTGKTSQSGTLTVTLSSDVAQAKTVTVSATGVITVD
ncbi:MAG: prepilin-type N-terminal cleavage/methylation domain-containing protein [Patescibacteria group bacterium]